MDLDRRQRLSIVHLGLLGLLVCSLGFTASAQANVYWETSTNSGAEIGRAADNGSIAKQDSDGIVSQSLSSKACGLAVDGHYLYWASPGANAIGRADLSSERPSTDDHWISGVEDPCGVAVDGGHVYWASAAHPNATGTQTATSIGRANLDGSNVEEDWIFDAGPEVCGVAVDGGHVYWGNVGGVLDGGVGRADLNGGSVETNWVDGATTANANSVCGVAVTSASVYWGNITNGTINRTSINGSSAQTLVEGVRDPSVGYARPLDLAVSSTHLYWTDQGSNSIGVSDLNGANINRSFVSNLSVPEGVAVDTRAAVADDTAPPGSAFGHPPVKNYPGQGEGAGSETRSPILLLHRHGGRVLILGRYFDPGSVVLKRQPGNHLIKRLKLRVGRQFQVSIQWSSKRSLTITARQQSKTFKSRLKAKAPKTSTQPTIYIGR